MTLALDTLPDDAASLKALIAALYADNTQLAVKCGHIEQEQAVLALANFCSLSTMTD